MKIFTKEDIKERKYIIISKNVYDLTLFQHPIINNIEIYYGTDCTEIFLNHHDFKKIEQLKCIGKYINKRDGLKEIEKIKTKILKMTQEEMEQQLKDIPRIIGIYDDIKKDFQIYTKFHGYRKSGKKSIIQSFIRENKEIDSIGYLSIETILPCLFEDGYKNLSLIMNMIGYQIQDRYQYLNQQDKMKYDYHLIIMNLIDPLSFEYAIKIYHEIKENNKLIIVTKMDLIEQFQISIQEVLETFDKVIFINSKINIMNSDFGSFKIIKEFFNDINFK